MRVLLVDDDDLIRTSYEAALLDLGMEVVACDRASDALALLKADEDAASIVPTESKYTEELSNVSGLIKQALTVRSGLDFDRAFIARQILDHAKALGIIDLLVVRAITASKLRDDLASMRPTIVKHLALALKVRRALEAQEP